MNKKLKVVFVCTKGGHLSEMLALKDLFENYNSILVTDQDESTKSLKLNIPVKYIACFMGERLNKVKVLTRFIKSFFQSFLICFKHRPDVIVTTGSNTAVPMCCIGKLWRAKVVFIESGARVYTRSRSGRIISKFADKIVVQWPEMLKFYPNAEYWGPIL